MYRFSVKVDIGVSEETNDDRALVGSTIVSDGELHGQCDNEYIVASVCDGVGGLAKGYMAATKTLEEIKNLNQEDMTIDNIKKSIEIANNNVLQAQIDENMQHGMRTTIAGIYADKEKFYVYNVGDSRVYRFRFKYLMQLSKDHSLVQDLIDLGEITPEEAKKHPNKNIINKCIGNIDDCVPRVIDMSDDFRENDIILICSDGISDELTDSEIKEIILKHKNDEDLKACCTEIHDKAIENGSLDNLSLVLLRKE